MKAMFALNPNVKFIGIGGENMIDVGMESFEDIQKMAVMGFVEVISHLRFLRNLINKVIDKIGSGDAMLAVIALCLKSGINRELALLIASLAAAQSVENIGNKESINKE